MKVICLECKNDVNLAAYPDLDKDMTIECDACGITLLVNDIDGDSIQVEVADEGK